VRARGMVGSFDYPGVGEFKALALPYKFLGWDDPAIGAPPALGEHTEAILKERLGYSDERIAALRQEKAI
jgi:crotonobetainyl-CoA:carnitine CoA-transferase CaiB-like acyl-CoA transferase